jgi:hypothetical protein
MFCRIGRDPYSALDGLELLKAVLHAHEGSRAGYADESRGANTETGATVATMLEVEVFVDDLLTHYDSNQDGLLTFPDFMISFSDHADRLKGKRPS